MKPRGISCMAWWTVCALSVAVLGGWGGMDDCEEDSGEVIRSIVTQGQLYSNVPVQNVKIEAIDLTGLPGAKGLNIEQIRDLLNKQPRQVLLESRIEEVSRGLSEEIGWPGLSKGFAVTTDYGNGRTNEQTFSPGMWSDKLDWQPKWLRYSFQDGGYRLVESAGGQAAPDSDTSPQRTDGASGKTAPALGDIPMLRRMYGRPPEPSPGKLMVFIRPVIVNEDGTAVPAWRGPRQGVTDGRTEGAATGPQPIPVGSPRYGRQNQIRVSVRGGYTVMDLESVPGTGTLIDGDDEEYFIKGDDRLTGYTVGGRVQIPLTVLRGERDRERAPLQGVEIPGDPDHMLYPYDDCDADCCVFRAPYLSLDLGYTSLSGDSDEEVDPLTLPTAITLINLESPGGFTGIGLGLTGLEGSTDTDYGQFFMNAGMGWSMRLARKTTLRVEPSFRYSRSTYEFDSELRDIQLPDNFVDLDQDLDVDNFGLGVTGRLMHRFNDTWSVYVGGDAGFYYYDADSDSSQQVIFPVLGPVEGDYTVNVDDSINGWGIAAGIELGLNARFGDWSVGGYGGFKWKSDEPYIRNPANPSEDETHLDTDSLTEGYIGVRAQYSF